ncbi:MAG: hypothetical protein VX762_03295 [Bacteroidota bacterium]|nr:hypothetical protein [Bacteroidota bacterium]
MKIKIYTNKMDILAIKESWDLLFAKRKYSVFQSFVYCYNSLFKASSPFVICLFSDEKIKELWPLELINNQLRFINDTHADFCDILSETDSSLIKEHLIANNQIGKLKLKNLTQDARVIKKLKGIAHLNVHASVNFLVLSLSKTDSFPSNFTHFVYRQKRRLMRILKKFSSEHLLFNNKSKVFPKKEILDLRNIMIEKGNRKHSFLDNHFLLLAEQLYNSGLLIVSVIKIKDNISGISLIFNNENRYSFWVDLFDDQKMINLYHNTLFIKNITENSDATFNFGRGAYDYKVQNYQPEVFGLFELNIFENMLEKVLFQMSQRTKKSIKQFYRKFKR